MRTTVLLLLSLLSFSPSLHAGWIVRPDIAHLEYSAKQGEGYESFDAALKALADTGRIQKLHGILAYQLLADETLQNEIFATLSRQAPRELQEALKSSGNMHNPKMLQIGRPFQRALLATPWMMKLNASLAPYGLTISRAALEKFELRATAAEPKRRFHGLLWLSITPSSSPRVGAPEAS